jgi:hypothetical protein
MARPAPRLAPLTTATRPRRRGGFQVLSRMRQMIVDRWRCGRRGGPGLVGVKNGVNLRDDIRSRDSVDYRFELKFEWNWLLSCHNVKVS